MIRKSIKIEDIDASERLRELRPDWVETFAEQIAAGEPLPAIEVAAKPDGKWLLLLGAHRLAAHAKAGRTIIDADVSDISALDADACRLREVKGNLVCAELSVLDRAVSLAEWKRIYEAKNPLPKRGRPAAGENGEKISNIFVERFSAAAARALGITERSVQLALEVASIDAEVRRKLALHEVSDSQSELLALARQSVARQREIAKLLLDPESGIAYVDDAIAAIDKTPAPARASAWEAISNKFSKLKEAQQYAFFDAHQDAIAIWQKSRKA
ncbi:ParB family chromosome partitioning protein [Rhodopseudomonas rhenobacensis]|uniref:ParB family chromosome partitioning protein n=1 Tax=Rhodopseudomonas rhenobacensis TaxID=87461 RepID=A0A7W7Z2T2_9BRAD|nr:hypothetical protein [Rhodopseudomonas rhenobacensis]MBB5046755.1 ParB family chromosome partitioning protein [Rhodopseudomonas rhenobacensis]